MPSPMLIKNPGITPQRRDERREEIRKLFPKLLCALPASAVLFPSFCQFVGKLIQKLIA